MNHEKLKLENLAELLSKNTSLEFETDNEHITLNESVHVLVANNKKTNQYDKMISNSFNHKNFNIYFYNQLKNVHNKEWSKLGLTGTTDLIGIGIKIKNHSLNEEDYNIIKTQTIKLSETLRYYNSMILR